MTRHELSTRPSSVGLPVRLQRGVSVRATELLTSHMIVWSCHVAGWWVFLWGSPLFCFLTCFPVPSSIHSVVRLFVASLFLLSFLLSGLQALPDCLALHLARVEQSELAKDMDGARAAFENLVTTAPSALAYVHFMRFVRRVDGAPAARKAFTRCRKDPAVTADTAHITYIAAAHIEYFLNKESRIARNVFELGAFLAWTSSCCICNVAVLRLDGWGVTRCLQWVWLVFGSPHPVSVSHCVCQVVSTYKRVLPLVCGLGVCARLGPFFLSSGLLLHLVVFCIHWTIALARRPVAGHFPAQLMEELPLALFLVSHHELCCEEYLSFPASLLCDVSVLTSTPSHALFTLLFCCLVVLTLLCVLHDFLWYAGPAFHGHCSLVEYGSFVVLVASTALHCRVYPTPPVIGLILGVWHVWVGLKKFPECVDFALEYIDFLWNQNDSEYLKVTFERILKILPAQVCSYESDIVRRFVLRQLLFRLQSLFAVLSTLRLELPRCEDLLCCILSGARADPFASLAVVRSLLFLLLSCFRLPHSYLFHRTSPPGGCGTAMFSTMYSLVTPPPSKL